MKNKLKFLTLFFLTFFLSLCLFSCSKSLHKILSDSVSEYRENYFYGENGSFFASFTDGKREKNYIYDGIKTDLVDYGVLVVKGDAPSQETLSFELTIEGEVFVGEMERNPFDRTFVFDIASRVSASDAISVYLPKFDLNIPLTCLSKDWEMTCHKALNKFADEKKAELQKYVSKEGFLGEIYIKLVADKNDRNNVYYYVLAVCRDGKVFGSLIDVQTGDIVQN